jgi:polyisoprenoid-binding protein YceI
MMPDTGKRNVGGRAVSVLVAIVLVLHVHSLVAAEYHVDTTAQRQVKFISETPLQNFDGVTSRIDGYVLIPSNALEPGTGYDGSRFYFEVDLNALDTGIGLRNRHMRENYLETDKYPFAQFTGRIAGVSPGSDTSLLVSTTGDLTIHGVKRPLSATIVAVRDQQRYHVRGQFSVALPDQKIKVPKLMFMKISDTIQVQLDFYLLDATHAEEGR